MLWTELVWSMMRVVCRKKYWDWRYRQSTVYSIGEVKTILGIKQKQANICVIAWMMSLPGRKPWHFFLNKSYICRFGSIGEGQTTRGKTKGIWKERGKGICQKKSPTFFKRKWGWAIKKLFKKRLKLGAQEFPIQLSNRKRGRACFLLHFAGLWMESNRNHRSRIADYTDPDHKPYYLADVFPASAVWGFLLSSATQIRHYSNCKAIPECGTVWGR